MGFLEGYRTACFLMQYARLRCASIQNCRVPSSLAPLGLTRNLSRKAQTARLINTRSGFAKMHAAAQIEGLNYTMYQASHRLWLQTLHRSSIQNKRLA